MKRAAAALGTAAGLWLVWQRARRKRPVSLKDKVVIITGASSGIGQATAHAFAAAGARVALAARRAEPLARTQAALAIYGTPTLGIPADISREEDGEALLQAVLAAWGRIDVLVNNAGVSYGGWLVDVPPERVRALVAVDFIGPARLTQRALAIMLRQPPDADGVRGHIVNVTSMAGQVPEPGMTVYSATRRALDAFTLAVRREVAGTGVRLSSVYPTWTTTPMVTGIDEAGLQRAGVLWPLEHFDAPEAPARAIIDAVRYNRRVVARGGPQARLAWLAEWITPELVDFYWRALVDLPAYMTLMRRLGTGGSPQAQPLQPVAAGEKLEQRV